MGRQPRLNTYTAVRSRRYRLRGQRIGKGKQGCWCSDFCHQGGQAGVLERAAVQGLMCASLGGLEQRALGIRGAQLAVAVAAPYRDNVGGEMGSSCVPCGVGVDQVLLGVFGDPSMLVVLLWPARWASGAIVLEKATGEATAGHAAVQCGYRGCVVRCRHVDRVGCLGQRGVGAAQPGRVFTMAFRMRVELSCEGRCRRGSGTRNAREGLAHDAATETCDGVQRFFR